MKALPFLLAISASIPLAHATVITSTYCQMGTTVVEGSTDCKLSYPDVAVSLAEARIFPLLGGYVNAHSGLGYIPFTTIEAYLSVYTIVQSPTSNVSLFQSAEFFTQGTGLATYSIPYTVSAFELNLSPARASVIINGVEQYPLYSKGWVRGLFTGTFLASEPLRISTKLTAQSSASRHGENSITSIHLEMLSISATSSDGQPLALFETPEPSTLALIVPGILALAWRRKCLYGATT